MYDNETPKDPGWSLFVLGEDLEELVDWTREMAAMLYGHEQPVDLRVLLEVMSLLVERSREKRWQERFMQVVQDSYPDGVA